MPVWRSRERTAMVARGSGVRVPSPAWGWSSLSACGAAVTRLSHKEKVAGSNPATPLGGFGRRIRRGAEPASKTGRTTTPSGVRDLRLPLRRPLSPVRARGRRLRGTTWGPPQAGRDEEITHSDSEGECPRRVGRLEGGSAESPSLAFESSALCFSKSEEGERRRVRRLRC